MEGLAYVMFLTADILDSSVLSMAYMGHKEARKYALTALFWLFITGGIIVGLVIYGVKLYREDRNFWINAELATAQIIAFTTGELCWNEPGHSGSTDPRYRKCEDQYFPIFKFLLNGKEYQAKGTLGWDSKPKVGEEIEIAYLPENPAHAKPVAEDKITIGGTLLVIGIFISIVLLFFVFILKGFIPEAWGLRPYDRS